MYETKNLPSTLILVITLAIGGCATWPGDLDADFRYQTTERITSVHHLEPDSRSSRAGLRRGDVVLSVDGENITEATVDKVMAAMTGPAGTIAELIILRDNKTYKVLIERVRKEK